MDIGSLCQYILKVYINPLTDLVSVFWVILSLILNVKKEEALHMTKLLRST